jgi:hypothetical protein
MPKIICRCGEALSYSEIPCRIEYKFISDVDYDKYEGIINADELYSQMRSILLCSKCSRLWIFWDGYKSAPTEYLKITD